MKSRVMPCSSAQAAKLPARNSGPSGDAIVAVDGAVPPALDLLETRLTRTGKVRLTLRRGTTTRMVVLALEAHR